MNETFRPFIDKFLVVYFDDIPIYSPTPELHLKHLEEVLRVLRKEKFYAASKKSSFMTDRVLFLGFVVSKDEIFADDSKVDAIKNWPTAEPT